MVKPENPSFRRIVKNRLLRDIQFPEIHGFELSSDMALELMVEQYKHLGFQASNIGYAVDIIREMKRKKSDIFLSMTSNMISSGLRDIIRQIVEKKAIKAIITTTGAIEEDIMKTQEAFYLGDFEIDDELLKKNAINRIGNIFVKDEQYCQFEKWHMKFIEAIVEKKLIFSPSEYIYELGKAVDNRESYLYHAYKNDIPVFVPGFTDGAIGDHIYFFNKSRKKDKLIIDVAKDIEILYDMIIFSKNVSGIILGGGIAKHHLIGAAILRNGLDYAIYIGTGSQYDGSLSGAKPREAVSWNKIKSEKNTIYIECDATIAFPLIAFSLLM